jgi:hypothetical protein
MTEKSRSAPKWCLWEVHRSDTEGDAFYTALPQYGPWDTERKARRSGEQLQRLESNDRELAVKELGEDDREPVLMPSDVSNEQTKNGTERNNEHLRWQSAAQHD